MRVTALDPERTGHATGNGRQRGRLRLLAALVLAAAAADAAACPRLPSADDALASRIVSLACTEHERWYAPFIDHEGRLASMRVSEAEAFALRDGTPAWQRVAQYWRNSGVRWPSPLLPDGTDCNVLNPADVPLERVALCRTFLIDTPWSAVFVSYVLTQSGAPGFSPSPRHVDFVRAAHRGEGPYRLADPLHTAATPGDLLCFVRQPGQPFGYGGLRDWLDRHPSALLGMHCDIVVAVDAPHARTVGGNVLQGVTMRLLPINRAGRFWNLPLRPGAPASCHPERPQACNLNRQDWAALLKLDPALRPALPVPSCEVAGCVACPLPMPAGVSRCERSAAALP